MTEGSEQSTTQTDRARTVAVTGASGFVGRYLVRELLSRGHKVRALVRDEAKAARVLPKDAVDDGRIALVVGEVLDGASPASLVEGADTCIHLIGIIRETGSGQTFERMHVRATGAMLEAAAGTGPEPLRYLHMSALGVKDNAPTAYQRTKFEAEQLVRGSGLPWTIFRPALIHGPDGEFMRFVKGWCEGRSAPFVFIPYFRRVDPDWTPPAPPRLVDPVVAPVRVQDVAWAFAEAIEREAAVGEIYNLCGPEEIPFPRMLEFVRDQLPLGKRSLRPIGIPAPLAAAKARAAKVFHLDGALPFDEGMALMGAEDSRAKLEKVRHDLGFDPAPFRESVAAYAAGM